MSSLPSGGAFASLFIALAQLPRLAQFWHQVNFTLFLVLSYLQLYSAITINDALINHSEFLFLNLPFMALLAPLLYLFATGLKQRMLKPRLGMLFHFLPFMTTTILVLPYLLIGEADKAVFVEVFLAERFIYPTSENQFMKIGHALPDNWASLQFIDYGAVLVIGVYVGAAMKKLYANLKKQPLFSNFNFYIFCWLMFGLLSCCAMLYSLWQNQMKFFAEFTVVSTLGFMIIYIAAEALAAFKSKARTKRRNLGKADRLLKIDLAALEKRLKKTLIDEKLFTDPELSLASLAEKLEISAHQLSEFINRRYQSNFNNFLNSYRIEEAQRILLTDLEKPTLSVAFEAGFNSYTAFFTAFRKVVKKSPQKFRKENH